MSIRVYDIYMCEHIYSNGGKQWAFLRHGRAAHVFTFLDLCMKKKFKWQDRSIYAVVILYGRGGAAFARYVICVMASRDVGRRDTSSLATPREPRGAA